MKCHRKAIFRNRVGRIALILSLITVFIWGDNMRLDKEKSTDDIQSAFGGYSVVEGDINGIGFYFVEIPKLNSDGSMIEFKVGVADNKPGSVKTVTEFAAERDALITINAGFFHMKDGTNLPYGAVIIDGKPMYNGSPYKNVRNAKTLAIMADGTFQYYPSGALDIDAMIADGVRHAVTGRLPIIINGVEADYDDSEGKYQVIGYDEENYYILTTEDGVQISDTADFLLKKGLLEAYVMDGGGSVSTNINAERINVKTTTDSKSERKVATFVYAVR